MSGYTDFTVMVFAFIGLIIGFVWDSLRRHYKENKKDKNTIEVKK